MWHLQGIRRTSSSIASGPWTTNNCTPNTAPCGQLSWPIMRRPSGCPSMNLRLARRSLRSRYHKADFCGRWERVETPNRSHQFSSQQTLLYFGREFFATSLSSSSWPLLQPLARLLSSQDYRWDNQEEKDMCYLVVFTRKMRPSKPGFRA